MHCPPLPENRATAVVTSIPSPPSAPANPALRPIISASPMPVNPATTGQYDDTVTAGWYGYRPALENRGITFGGSLIQDDSWNFSGGVSTRHIVYRARLDLNISFDTDRLFHLPGGQIYCDLMSIWGRDGNTSLLGSLQGFDNIDAAPSVTEVYELYYRQKLWRDSLELKVGRMDANNVFDAQPDTGSFLIPSTTNAATDYLLPTFPSTVPGAVAYLRPLKDTTLKLGLFYTDRFHPTMLDQFLNTLEPSNQPMGTLLIGELDQQYRLGAGLPGEAGLGIFYHLGQVHRLDAGTQNGFAGGYGFIDQTFWRPSDHKSLACFTTLSAVDGRVSPIDYASSDGLLGTGLFPGRPDDLIGLAANWAHVSARAGLPQPWELGLESFYQFNLRRGISLQPDLQYWIHPGGGAYPDALVATIRLSLTF